MGAALTIINVIIGLTLIGICICIILLFSPSISGDLSYKALGITFGVMLFVNTVGWIYKINNYNSHAPSVGWRERMMNKSGFNTPMMYPPVATPIQPIITQPGQALSQSVQYPSQDHPSNMNIYTAIN